MNDRPSRRARLALLAAGVLVSAAVVAVGAVIAGLGAVMVPAPVAALAAVPAVAGLAAGWSAQARRTSTGVLVAAAQIAAVGVAVVLGLLLLLLFLGRMPAGGERNVVGPAAAAVLITAAVAGPLARRAGRRMRAALHAVRRAPDELLADFAENAGRGSPVDDLLRTLAESMRRDWQLSRVEVWTAPDEVAVPGPANVVSAMDPAADSGLHRTLVVPSPLDPEADPVPAPLDAAELGMLRRAGVAGPGWLRLWVPRLLLGRGERETVARPAAALRPGAARRRRAGAGRHRATRRRAAVHHRGRPRPGRGRAPAGHRAAQPQPRRGAAATLADLRRANADLQASRRRLVTTADAERRRIERDLHDGAQQHLVALAVGIRLVRDALAAGASAGDVDLLDELDRGVRESIASLRDLAHGIYPPLLRDAGLGEALRAAAKRSPLDVTVRAGTLGRHPEQVEAAVYLLLPRGAGQRGQARARRVRDDHPGGGARRAALRGHRHRAGLRAGPHPGGRGPVEHGRPHRGPGR